MGLSNPENPDKYKQHSVVIVPADAPGVRVLRPMEVFGYDDAPEGHCEVVYDSVRVPVGNLVLGWGRGFEVRSLTSHGMADELGADHSRAAGVSPWLAVSDMLWLTVGVVRGASTTACAR